ncbi:hypothetical protein [Streptomyces sp. CBMA156]|uniref:hypothetical protein n=1 Tax=Streptomyces sp. CBMA156 TaxID=1930280 RepID=UPI001661BFE0|nr:hypothetical protein [Streptomyces sp. CBMA156]MBD0670218.1 hypothetical protein [Streptomyces sp. CBMA156]
MSDQPPLLTYRPSTSPAPLQASTPGTGTDGRVNLAVSTGKNTVYCDQILLSIPKDAESGGAYFASKPHISTGSDRWTVASLVSVSAEEIGGKGKAEYWRATLKSAGEEYDQVEGTLDFGISGELGTSAGTMNCYITEYSATTPGRKSYSHETFVLPLPVTGPVFYLHTFLARGSASATAPKTVFNRNDSVYLSWESNGAYFRVYDGEGRIVHEGPETFCSPGADHLTMDTTFTVEASMSSTPEGDSFKPVYQYATLALSVKDPVLAALTVEGEISGRSGLDLAGTATVYYLTVNGSAGIGSSLSVSGSATVQSSLTTNGYLSVGSTVYANSDLRVSGTLEANGDLNANSTLNAYGEVHAVSDNFVRIRELRGPYGVKLTINSNTELISGCELDVSGDIKRKGHGVLSDQDTIGLNNKYYGGYLYASDYERDSDRRIPYVWVPGDRVAQSYWQISRG